MKIIVKTLKGNCFDMRVNSCDTIVDVKKQIENVHGAELYPADKQVLIHKGKVLKDATTLEENNVVENSFLVIMLSKAKSASSEGLSATPAGQAQSQTSTAPETVPTLTTPQAQPQTTTESVAAPATTAPSAEANVYGQAASNLVAGGGLDTTIQQILDMGGGSWDRDTVVRALRAAFNNPERAIEYLYSGIPEQAEVPPVARAPVASSTPTGGQAAELPAQVPQGALPSGGPNASPLNLFPQGLPNVGSNTGAGSLDFLRNNQQFQALRAMVRANPYILQPMLQELGKQNPHVMRLIQEHQNDFVRLMSEPVEGGEGDAAAQLASDVPPTLSVTTEEREAIERLEAMGFRRATALQVYFACDKDETMAANYLLDHIEEFANEDDEEGALS